MITPHTTTTPLHHHTSHYCVTPFHISTSHQYPTIHYITTPTHTASRHTTTPPHCIITPPHYTLHHHIKTYESPHNHTIKPHTTTTPHNTTTHHTTASHLTTTRHITQPSHHTSPHYSTVSQQAAYKPCFLHLALLSCGQTLCHRHALKLCGICRLPRCENNSSHFCCHKIDASSGPVLRGNTAKALLARHCQTNEL